MDQQKRLFVAIALSFGLTLVYTNFFSGPDAAEQARLAALDAGAHLAAADAGAQPIAVVPTPPTPPTPATVAAADAGAAVAVAPPPTLPTVEAPPLRRLEQSRATMSLAFSTEGGAFEDAVLKGRRERVQQELSVLDGYKALFGAKFPPPAQIDLAQPMPTLGQFAVSITGAAPVSPRARYAVTDDQPGRVIFTTTQGPWQVTKTLTWDATARGLPEDWKAEKSATGYSFALSVDMKNVGAQPLTGELGLHTSRAIEPGSETEPSFFGGIGNQAWVLCSTTEVHRKQPDDKPAQEATGKVAYVGIDQQYFLSAAWPTGGAADGRCSIRASTTERIAELFLPLTVQPGETVTRSFGLFMGPKDFDLLKLVGVAKGPGATAAAAVATSPNLDTAVDFGWWAFICKALLIFLRFFHRVGDNWGIAIVLLTVMVKVVLLPLTHRAMVSAEQMKKLQPKMEELRKKFAGDKERQNVEMMKLYQEAKVNPLGGCLPLLLQLPIWAALFTTLRNSYEIYGEPFFGVWADLTSKDPTYLFPLLLGVTMIVTQRLQPQMMDKSQAFLITWVMPVFFTAIMLNYPSGLSLYIFTNNLLSIGQQYGLRRYLERKAGTAAPKAGVGKPA